MTIAAARTKWLNESNLSLGIAGNHSVTIGRLGESDDANTGFKASELLLLSLAGCFNSTLVRATKSRQISLTKLDTQVYAESAENPSRFSALRLEVDLAATDKDGIELSAEELDKLIEIAERGCFITNTLRPSVAITIQQASQTLALV
jgi:putative redox protein